MKVKPLDTFTPRPELQTKSSPKTPKSFSDLLRQEIEAVDAAQKARETRLVDLATGKNPDLVSLSLITAKAELSFKLLLQVRNKILEAYQEIMRMQL